MTEQPHAAPVTETMKQPLANTRNYRPNPVPGTLKGHFADLTPGGAEVQRRLGGGGGPETKAHALGDRDGAEERRARDTRHYLPGRRSSRPRSGIRVHSGRLFNS